MSDKDRNDDEVQEGDRLPGEQPPSEEEIVSMGQIDLADDSRGQDEVFEDSGEPVADASPADSEQLVTIMINGQPYDLPESAAIAYAEEQSRSRDTAPAAPRGEQAQSEEEDFSELIFTDPQEYQRRLRESITSELKQQYQTQRSSDQFWTDFYSEHEDLKPDDKLVKVVLETNMGTLGNLPTKVAQGKLADLTRKEILSIAKRHAGGRQETPADNLEGAQGGQPAPSAEPQTINQHQQQPRMPNTLGSALRERRRARRQAALGTE